MRSLLSWHKAQFQIMSDFHLEVGQHYSHFSIPPRAPFLVLAGDIGRLADYKSYVVFLHTQCTQYERVFLVLGNHEFYGVSREEGRRLAESLEREHSMNGKLTILNRTRIILEGYPDITILGCTLNSHILPEAQQIVASKVKDFQRIINWTVQNHNVEHLKDVEWLQTQISQIRKEKSGHLRRIMVVTHHAPSTRGTSKPSDEGNAWSSAFGTDLLSIQGQSSLNDVQWWIFGHTHYTTEFSLGGVKLVSNQRGYVLPKSPENESASTKTLKSRIRELVNSASREKDTFRVGKVIKI